MSPMLRVPLFFLLVLVVMFSMSAFIGCGEEESPTPQPLDVSGVVVKGPIAGASVEIRAIGSDGGPGDLVAGPVTTLADGSWSATLSDGEDKQLLVVAQGGSYVDETTSSNVVLTAGQELVGYLNTSTGNTATVSPVTHAMYIGACCLVDDRAMAPGAAWDACCVAFEPFEFDPLTTVPNEDGSPQQKLYAALLAGFSALAHEDEVAGLGSNAFAVVSALSEDLGDGRFDARRPDSSEIFIGGEAFPALGEDDIGRLEEAAERAAGDETLWDSLYVKPISGDCDALLVSARHELENVLFEEINADDPERPADVDFEYVKELYESVLVCDANHTEAHLVLSLLEIATLSSDPDVNAAFDAWKDYLDNNVPFETDPPALSGFANFGLARGRGSFSLPIAAVRGTVFAYLSASRLEEVPQISDVQAILTDKVLPAANRAIGHLDHVLGDPAYQFTITPRMQGDLLEESLFADRTDFLATRGALYGLRAACNVATSYHVSMPAYDEANIYAALDQETGTWLRLRPGGEQRMESVPADLGAAAQDLDAAITALFAEIDSGDSQNDEVIKIGPDLPSRADIAEFQDDELPRIMRSLQGPTEESYDWDFDESTPDVELTVDLRAFFMDPVQDFKTLAPAYALTTEIVPHDTDWREDEGDLLDVYVNVPEDTFVGGGYCYGYIEDFDDEWQYCDFDAWLQDAVQAAIAALVETITDEPDWAGYLSYSVSFSGGDFDPGPQTLTMDLWIGYDVAESWVTIPVITFEADSYAEWAADFPDPQVNGLFPDAISAMELLTIFGMDAYDWRKTVRIDWAD